MLLDIAGNVKHGLDKLYDEIPLFRRMINDIVATEGTPYLFGGSVRDLGYFKRKPNDLDIVVDTQNIDLERHFVGMNFRKNRYDGYKVFIPGMEIDIWSLPITFAFRTGIVKESVPNLLQTTTLSTDSILYNISKQKILDNGCVDSLKNKCIDIQLIPESKHEISINFIRALVFADGNDFTFSRDLYSIFYDWYDNDPKRSHQDLMDQYMSHYKREITWERVHSLLKQHRS